MCALTHTRKDTKQFKLINFGKTEVSLNLKIILVCLYLEIFIGKFVSHLCH